MAVRRYLHTSPLPRLRAYQEATRARRLQEQTLPRRPQGVGALLAPPEPLRCSALRRETSAAVGEAGIYTAFGLSPGDPAPRRRAEDRELIPRQLGLPRGLYPNRVRGCHRQNDSGELNCPGSRRTTALGSHRAPHLTTLAWVGGKKSRQPPVRGCPGRGLNDP